MISLRLGILGNRLVLLFPVTVTSGREKAPCISAFLLLFSFCILGIVGTAEGLSAPFQEDIDSGACEPLRGYCVSGIGYGSGCGFH
jgi:hypothetical protein